MSPFQLLKVFGRWLPGAAGEFTGIGLFTACIIVWLLIPFVDPDGSSGKRAKLAIYIGLVFLFGLIGTTIWGYWDL